MWVEPEDIGTERSQIFGDAILDQFLSDLGLPKFAPNQEFSRNRTSILYINQNVKYRKYSHGNRFAIDFRSFNPFIILTLRSFFLALRSPQVEKTDSRAGLDRQLKKHLLFETKHMFNSNFLKKKSSFFWKHCS